MPTGFGSVSPEGVGPALRLVLVAISSPRGALSLSSWEVSTYKALTTGEGVAVERNVELSSATGAVNSVWPV